VYFDSADTFSDRMDELLTEPGRLDALQQQGQSRFQGAFSWPEVLNRYEVLLDQYLPA
jgi:hypothetical protein